MKTLGEVYREKILSRTDLVERELQIAAPNDEMKVVRDLFGWNITIGRELVECRSEDEARYLALFFSAGMHSVMVPQDNEFLKEMVPKLEARKKRIDEIIEEESAGLLRQKYRDQLRRVVYPQIIK